MLLSLWLPIIVSAVVLFFASFLSWMVVQLHKQDWLKLENEDEFLNAAREVGLKPGNYMFPGVTSSKEMKSEEYQKKMEQGPCGVITVFGETSMGRNLALTMLYFLACSFCLAYLATIAFPAETPHVQPEFMDVFRFVATAGFLTFLPAILQHAIWFHNRILGHVIECIVYALIVGGIFAALWPS